MTRIGIIGGGKGATLHADAIIHIAAPTSSESEGGLAPQVSSLLLPTRPDLSLDDLCAGSDALIVAVPPPDVGGVLTAIDDRIADGADVKAVLVEAPFDELQSLRYRSPWAPTSSTPPSCAKACAKSKMREPHHLQMRVRQPKPDWGLTAPRRSVARCTTRVSVSLRCCCRQLRRLPSMSTSSTPNTACMRRSS